MVQVFAWTAKGAVLVLGLVAFAAAAGGLIPIIAILGNFAFYALLAALGLAVALWRTGAQRWAMASAGIALVNATLVLPTMFAAASAVPPGAQSAKLLLFNVHWNNRNFVAIQKLLVANDPDVVVLQEIHARNRRELKPLLDGLYPYQVACGDDPSCDVWILSRKPLRQSMVSRDQSEAAVAIAQTSFDIGPCPVALFSAHLNRPWPYHSLASDGAQYKQIAALADAAKGWPGAKIIAGDMNAATWTPMVRKLADATAGRALGGVSGSWPWFLTSALKLPIDQVIVSTPALRATRQVLDPTGSDHSPVLATIYVADAGRCGG